MIARLVLASLIVAQANAPATHDFSNDYLIGTWSCQTQIGTGTGSGTVTYTARNGGTSMHQKGRVQLVGPGVVVNGTYVNRIFIDADITYEGPVTGYMWRNQYSELTSRALRSTDWWKNGTLRMDVVNGNGRHLILRQVNANQYSLNNESLSANMVLTQTCNRQH